jgi:hypothetical protein
MTLQGHVTLLHTFYIKITLRTCKTIRYVALVVLYNVHTTTWSHDLSEIM